MRISSVEATEGGGYRQVQFERPSSREAIIHLEHSLAPNQGLAVKVFTAPIDTPSSSARQLLKVTAGSMQSCALTLGGALYGCGLPTTDGKAIEVSAGVGRNFMCGLEANAVDRRDSGILGLLGATGELMRGKVVAIVKMPTRGPTSIGASMFNACATFEVGLVACQGNWHDMLFAPHPVEGLLVARAISVNVNRACVLTAHDEVQCWGDRPQDIKDRVLQTTYTVAPQRVSIPN